MKKLLPLVGSVATLLLSPLASAHADSGIYAMNDKHSGAYLGLGLFYLKPSETGLGQITDSWQYAISMVQRH